MPFPLSSFFFYSFCTYFSSLIFIFLFASFFLLSRFFFLHLCFLRLFFFSSCSYPCLISPFPFYLIHQFIILPLFPVFFTVLLLGHLFLLFPFSDIYFQSVVVNAGASGVYLVTRRVPLQEFHTVVYSPLISIITTAIGLRYAPLNSSDMEQCWNASTQWTVRLYCSRSLWVQRETHGGSAGQRPRAWPTGERL